MTGSLASGKSEVCRLFAEMGAEVVSADQIAHQLLDPQTELGKQIIGLLGEEVLVEGKFNRDRIAAKVFPNGDLLRKLEELLHPRILEEIEEKYNKCTSPLFVVEVPLLFECGWEKHFDETILVVADREVRAKRFMKSDFQLREARFLPDAVKKRKADVVIENQSTLEDLKKQITS